MGGLADCILHVEHHALREECLLAALAWTETQRPSTVVTLVELYSRRYEYLAWRAEIDRVGARSAPLRLIKDENPGHRGR